ncbi:hypothetical protein GOP47_0014252 [Adiantum capillus-veneris]|uniref:Uncharacterized protein n=1 Tax=Adiantum capillus-veneris TaxID=13818 RepID=A0A9D4ZCA7_ADICA|nr:hypothetical protein GOP47_0014252 [Adiantum capillus-veneris]
MTYELPLAQVEDKEKKKIIEVLKIIAKWTVRRLVLIAIIPRKVHKQESEKKSTTVEESRLIQLTIRVGSSIAPLEPSKEEEQALPRELAMLQQQETHPCQVSSVRLSSRNLLRKLDKDMIKQDMQCAHLLAED